MATLQKGTYETANGNALHDGRDHNWNGSKLISIPVECPFAKTSDDFTSCRNFLFIWIAPLLLYPPLP